MWWLGWLEKSFCYIAQSTADDAQLEHHLCHFVALHVPSKFAATGVSLFCNQLRGFALQGRMSSDILGVGLFPSTEML